MFFFFHDPATTEIYTLSLHDALPIYKLNLTASQARAWLTYKQAQGKSKITQNLAQEELEKGMSGALITARANAVSTAVEDRSGLKVPFRDYRTNAKNIY